MDVETLRITRKVTSSTFTERSNAKSKHREIPNMDGMRVTKQVLVLKNIKNMPRIRKKKKPLGKQESIVFNHDRHFFTAFLTTYVYYIIYNIYIGLLMLNSCTTKNFHQAFSKSKPPESLKYIQATRRVYL